MRSNDWLPFPGHSDIPGAMSTDMSGASLLTYKPMSQVNRILKIVKLIKFLKNFNNLQKFEFYKKEPLDCMAVIYFLQLEYGTIFCFGSNIVGRQEQPCVFHIIPASKSSHQFSLFSSRNCVAFKMKIFGGPSWDIITILSRFNAF